MTKLGHAILCTLILFFLTLGWRGLNMAPKMMQLRTSPAVTSRAPFHPNWFINLINRVGLIIYVITSFNSTSAVLEKRSTQEAQHLRSAALKKRTTWIQMMQLRTIPAVTIRAPFQPKWLINLINRVGLIIYVI